MNNNNNPIGMIDSGLGGLSLFKHIRQALPNEDIIYFADSKNMSRMETKRLDCFTNHAFNFKLSCSGQMQSDRNCL